MITAIIVIFFSAFFLILALDILLAWRKGEKGTLSVWLYERSKEHPIIPALLCLVIGVLIGHVWWQNLCH